LHFLQTHASNLKRSQAASLFHEAIIGSGGRSASPLPQIAGEQTSHAGIRRWRAFGHATLRTTSFELPSRWLFVGRDTGWPNPDVGSFHLRDFGVTYGVFPREHALSVQKTASYGDGGKEFN
jgi:hypothetical protein